MMQDDLTHDNFDFRGFSKENRHETELIRDEEERSSKKPAKAGKAGKQQSRQERQGCRPGAQGREGWEGREEGRRVGQAAG